jgi:hypothetical protein
MPSLYDIKQELIDCTDLETGEIVDTAKFEALQMEANEKIENVALWYKNLLADVAAYKAEKDHFAERERITKNKAESLKKYLDGALAGKKFNTTRVAIAYRKSTVVEYDGQTKVPEDYLKQAEPTIDKATIAKDLKDGKKISGFTLKENNNIQIK